MFDVFYKSVNAKPQISRHFLFNDILDWGFTGWDAKVGFIYQGFSSIKLGVRVGGALNFQQLTL